MNDSSLRPGQPSGEMKVAVIDDEEHARVAMKNMLWQYCPEAELVGEAGCIEEGIRMIRETGPEVIFLDVRMPDGGGFELLEQLKGWNFRVIFVTAYDEYAIKAFRYNALDYLAKPVEPDELIEALEKARKPHPLYSDMKQLLKEFRENSSFKRIAISSVSKIEYLPVCEIVRCESDGQYTSVCLMNGDQVLSTKPLREYDLLLRDNGFYRIHRSHLINLSRVKVYNKLPENSIIMEDGSKVEISRERRLDFLQVMSER